MKLIIWVIDWYRNRYSGSPVSSGERPGSRMHIAVLWTRLPADQGARGESLQLYFPLVLPREMQQMSVRAGDSYLQLINLQNNRFGQLKGHANVM